jgi:hypothetical protein
MEQHGEESTSPDVRARSTTEQSSAPSGASSKRTTGLEPATFGLGSRSGEDDP